MDSIPSKRCNNKNIGTHTRQRFRCDQIINYISELEKKKLEIAHLITEIENNPELLDANVFEQSIQSNLSAQKVIIQQLVMHNLTNSVF